MQKSKVLFVLVLIVPMLASADSFFGNLLRDVKEGFSGVVTSVQNQNPNPATSSDAPVRIPADVSPSSPDSSYNLTDGVDPTAVLYHAEITMEGAPNYRETVMFPISNGVVSHKIYLTNGPGVYRVDAWFSKNPDHFQDPVGFQFSKSFTVKNLDTRDMSYLLPTGDVESDAPAIITKMQEITAGLTTDADKALAIHDWVAGHIAYDTQAYFSGSYAHSTYDATTVLAKGSSVCFGYSTLFASLARAAGLRAKVIDGSIIWPSLGQSWAAQGDSQTHAWNEVLVEGRWITLDATWDSGNVDFTTQTFKQNLTHQYYDPAPEAFAVDHRKVKDDIDD